MCGIAGLYSNNGIFSREHLENMTGCLAHRGPDAAGYFDENGIFLGHRRLSIIDLSPEANQPMTSRCGRYVIVYNGEVYNFSRLAKEEQIPLRTHSDTEVILETFAKHGVSVASRLHGMFAFVIYDKQEKRFYLFRDRLGKKPLYYFCDSVCFAFASEIKALMSLQYIRNNNKLSLPAINEYLYLGFIPEPLSIYNKIFKLPAGHYAVFDIPEQRFTIYPYWKPEEQIGGQTVNNPMEVKQRLNELITCSVKDRLISDVPLGVFLSGGTDSSLVTAIACKVSPQKIKTYTIGFHEQKYNEAQHAAIIARYLDTDHHEFIVSWKDAIPLVESITDIFDEPYADSSAIPTLLVSKLAKQHVTVALTGDGGDELFHGYGAYLWAQRLARTDVQALRKIIAPALSMLSNRYRRISNLFRYPTTERIKSHILSQEQYMFSQIELHELLTPAFRADFSFSENPGNLARRLSPAERQALFDLSFYLKDDLLIKTDRACMAYSLEARSPLLDHRLVEYALTISPKLKIKGSVQKYILKQLLYDYIPASFFNRPKRGFAIPLSLWLKNELKHLVDDHLSEETVNRFGMVNYNTVKKLKFDYFSGQNYLYNRIWLLIVLHMWLKKNKDIRL